MGKWGFVCLFLCLLVCLEITISCSFKLTFKFLSQNTALPYQQIIH